MPTGDQFSFPDYTTDKPTDCPVTSITIEPSTGLSLSGPTGTGTKYWYVRPIDPTIVKDYIFHVVVKAKGTQATSAGGDALWIKSAQITYSVTCPDGL